MQPMEPTCASENDENYGSFLAADVKLQASLPFPASPTPSSARPSNSIEAAQPLGTACTDSLFSLNFCSFRDAMRSIYGVTATMRPLRRVTVTNRYRFFSFLFGWDTFILYNKPEYFIGG